MTYQPQDFFVTNWDKSENEIDRELQDFLASIEEDLDDTRAFYENEFARCARDNREYFE